MTHSEPLSMILVAEGSLEANLYQSMLEAHGIPVFLMQEAAGSVFAVQVGPLGEVEVYVPERLRSEALAIVEAYRSGRLQTTDEPSDEDSS